MKLAIISGGSRGLGAALCEQYAESGCKLVEFSRSAPHPFSIRCDFSNPGDLAEVVAEHLEALAEQRFDEIVVISNAATLDPIGPASRRAAIDIQRNLDTSFVSAIMFMTEAVRAFQNVVARKTVINISSGAALKGHAGWSLYCASKAGLENYIRALAAEQALEPRPFSALNIDPGVMDTSMQEAIRASAVEDFPTLGRFIELHREGALRHPAKVAEAIRTIIASEHPNGARLAAADFL